MALQDTDLVPESEMEKEDTRDSKKRYLVTDAICCICGCINNYFWEKKCVICKGDRRNFISGKIGVDIRLLIGFHLEDLKALCEIEGISQGTRAKMVVGILKKFYGKSKKISGGSIDNIDRRIDERLVRKIITRNKRAYWYLIDIEGAMERAKRSK